MHKLFGEWYRAAKIEPKSEWLPKRWEAIEKFKLPKDGILWELELVRLFNLQPAKDDKFTDTFQSAFQESDPTFPMRNNKVELSVLAGAKIIHCLEKYPSRFANIIALATLCNNCQGLAPQVPVPDILASATKYLIKKAANLRSKKLFEINTPNEYSPGSLEKLLEEVKNKSHEIDKRVTNLLEQLVTAADNSHLILTSVKEILNRQKLLEEETNILWWLFGEYSRDLERPVRELTISKVCLVIGKELADLTNSIPGPFSAEAFLDKMISASKTEGTKKKNSIANAVNASSRDWRNRLISQTRNQAVIDFCPVHFAIEKSIETHGTDDWLPAFQKSASISAKKNIAPLDLSKQIYQERLLIKAVESFG